MRNGTAWIVRNGGAVSIPSEEVQVGGEAVAVVFAAETIPVHGEIVQAEALIGQETITGEGLPVMHGVGKPGS